MKYTRIDADAEVSALLIAKAAEARWHAYLLRLDASALRWAAGIAASTKSGDEGEDADERSKEMEKEAAEADARADRLAKRAKGGKKTTAAIDRLVADRIAEWVPTFVEQVEREHAQNAVLAEVAVADGDEETATKYELAMLHNEGSQIAALRLTPGLP